LGGNLEGVRSRRSQTPKTEREARSGQGNVEGGAKRKLSELLREVNSPDHQPESSLTLDEFWSKFEELVLPKKRYSTRKDMTQTYKLYVKPEFGSRPMKEHQQRMKYYVHAEEKSGRQVAARDRPRPRSVDEGPGDQVEFAEF